MLLSEMEGEAANLCALLGRRRRRASHPVVVLIEAAAAAGVLVERIDGAQAEAAASASAGAGEEEAAPAGVHDAIHAEQVHGLRPLRRLHAGRRRG